MQHDDKARVDANLAAAAPELYAALNRFIFWAGQQCPCSEEKPDPCPLCGAGVENLEACKAMESTFPKDILRGARAALSKARGEGQ